MLPHPYSCVSSEGLLRKTHRTIGTRASHPEILSRLQAYAVREEKRSDENSPFSKLSGPVSVFVWYIYQVHFGAFFNGKSGQLFPRDQLTWLT